MVEHNIRYNNHGVLRGNDKQFNSQCVGGSMDKSWEYYAFVIVMLVLPPLQRFLVCTLHLRVLVQSFSTSGHMSLAQRCRCQAILGTLRYHLLSKGYQMHFCCVNSRDQSFQPIFFSYSHQICIGPRSSSNSPQTFI